MNFYNKYSAFKAGKLSQAEAEEFVEWMNSREGEDAVLEEIQNDWNYLEAREATDETRLESIFSRIKKETDEVSHLHAGRNYFMKIAASIAMILAFGILAYLVFPELQSLNQPTQIVKSNPSGQKSTHFLPDGSKVYLNAASSIAYLADFDGEVRGVELIGEAFFEVVKNPDKPFVVKSRNFTTTALGTSFNIKAYDAEDQMEIALTSGRVKVDADHLGEQIYLLPGENVTYFDREGTIQKSTFEADNVISWKNGRIKFDEASYEEVKNRLERWYGVQISTNKVQSQNWTYSGSFENQSLEMILEGMKLTKNFTYEIDQKTVKIMFN